MVALPADRYAPADALLWQNRGGSSWIVFLVILYLLGYNRFFFLVDTSTTDALRLLLKTISNLL